MPPSATATEPRLTATFRRKRRAGRLGVGMFLAGALLSLTGVPSRLLPPAALGSLGWTSLMLILWASACPTCGGAIALSGDRCVSCRDSLRTEAATPRNVWRHLPVLGRVLVLVAALIGVLALLSFGGAD
jgi:hypothetical protein